MNPLEKAIRDNNINQLRLLLDLGHDPNSRTSQFGSLTKLAISSDAAGCLKVLMDRNLAEKEICISFQESVPLFCYAVEKGGILVNRLLIEKGSDVNMLHPIKQKPVLHVLFENVRQETPELIELLLSFGADINITDSQGRTILHIQPSIAVYHDYFSLFKYFVECGADPRISDKFGQIPLHIIAKEDIGKNEDNPNIDSYFELNKEFGVNINAVDKSGNTPLMLAATERNVLFCKFLIKHGADIHIKNKNGFTALDLVTKPHLTTIDSLEIIEVIITSSKYNHIPDAHELYDWLLMIFKEHKVYWENLEMDFNKQRNIDYFEKSKKQVHAFLSMLIKKFPLAKEILGQFLFYFLSTRQLYLAKTIIEEFDADVNTANENGVTPIFYAASYNLINFAELFVENGALVSVSNEYHITPLIEAVKNNATEVAVLLLEHGADIHVIDWEGNTAMDYAKRKGNNELLKQMIKSASK